MFFCIKISFSDHDKNRKGDFMNTVPAMISTKDLSYLEDMMNWNLTLSKKAEHYSKEVKEEALKDAFTSLAHTCKEHYESLLQSLTIGGSHE